MKVPTVLIADDNENDKNLLGWAFKKAGARVRLDFVGDGTEVVRYLQIQALPRARGRLSLLMLDLKMPLMDGFEVLEWLQQCPEFRPPRVVVYSSCSCPDDLRRVSLLGVDHYFVKPSEPAELVSVVKRLEDYWDGASTADKGERDAKARSETGDSLKVAV